MAEVVGLIASVVTLCQTVDYLRKGTKLVALLNGAPDEYFHLHNEVRSSSPMRLTDTCPNSRLSLVND
jgi:hypothetical protein